MNMKLQKKRLIKKWKATFRSHTRYKSSGEAIYDCSIKIINEKV